MSAATPGCPSERQWRERMAHRFDPERSEPASWPQDLAHLDRCTPCRERASELDPTLLFRRLAAPLPALDEAADVAAMQDAVAALRRAERVARPVRRPLAQWAAGARWAAAALVVLSALSLGAGVWSGGASGAGAPVGLAAQPAVPELPQEALALQEALDSMPLIEPVDVSTTGEVEDSLIWETDEMALIWVGDSEGPQDV